MCSLFDIFVTLTLRSYIIYSYNEQYNINKRCSFKKPLPTIFHRVGNVNNTRKSLKIKKLEKGGCLPTKLGRDKTTKNWDANHRMYENTMYVYLDGVQNQNKNIGKNKKFLKRNES